MASYKNYPCEKIETLREMYHKSVDKFGELPLFLQKENGTYKTYSYRRYGADVDSLGTALCAKGYGGDSRILVIGENSYEWAISYMAVICGGGVVVPVDKEIPTEEIANIAQICEAKAVIYSRRVAAKIEALDPSVARICFTELGEWIEMGRRELTYGNRSYLDAPIDPDAMAAILFTSGTTGVAKGVMLSHHNLCFTIMESCQMAYLGPGDIFLSVLPVHHAYECTCGMLCQIYKGSAIAFCEGLRHITKNMQEVRPTAINCVPLLLETMYNKIWSNIRKQGMEKKVNAMIKMTNAIRHEKTRLAVKRRIFSTIHKSFGGRLRVFICGGAAIAPEILKGLGDLGFLTLQGYGLTECAPIAAMNRDMWHKDASAGMATPNALLDIYDVQDDGTGEIRYRGENVMLGYYKRPDLTAEVIRNNWFYTGDFGYLDEDGFLYITGRKKNVIVTHNGKNIFPEELETYLSRSEFVKESVVVGYDNPKKKDYDVVAIIYPDYERMEEVYGKDYTDEQLNREMAKAISTVNGQVQSYKRIETFVIRKEEFPKNTSRKIKRAGIAESAFDDYCRKVKRSV